MRPDTEPKCPDLACKRYSTLVFPPYRYVPGFNIHPSRDKSGYAFGHVTTPHPPFNPLDWQNLTFYLYGVDLFNFAYWWEAHEAWEHLWMTTQKEAATGQFLQGLIQLAAALIKWNLGEVKGQNKLYDLGSNRLQFVYKQHPIFMGLDLGVFLQQCRLHFTEKSPTQKSTYPFITLINF